MKPRIAITVGDPAGIGPEIAGKAAADPRVREVCEPVLYAPPPTRPSPTAQVSAAAGRAAYDAIVRAVDDARAGEVRRRRHRAGQQGRLRRCRPAWKGHTDLLGASVRRAARGDDVPCADAEGGAGDRARAAARRAGPAHPRARRRRRCALTAARAARASASPRRGWRWPASIRTPAKAVSWARGRRRAGAGGADGARSRTSTSRGPLPADTVFVRAVARRVRLRAWPAITTRDSMPVKLLAFGHGRQRHARPADHPHVGRPRHRLRHRRPGRGRSRQPGRGRAARRGAGDARGSSRREPPHAPAARARPATAARRRADAHRRKPQGVHDYHILETFEAGVRCSAPRSRASARARPTCATATRAWRRARCGSTTCTSIPTAIAATSTTIRSAAASCCCTRRRSAS